MRRKVGFGSIIVMRTERFRKDLLPHQPREKPVGHLTTGALNSKDRRCKTANSAAIAPSAKPARAASAGFAFV